jgi:hypothetical protein
MENRFDIKKETTATTTEPWGCYTKRMGGTKHASHRVATKNKESGASTATEPYHDCCRKRAGE